MNVYNRDWKYLLQISHTLQVPWKKNSKLTPFVGFKMYFRGGVSTKNNSLFEILLKKGFYSFYVCMLLLYPMYFFSQKSSSLSSLPLGFPKVSEFHWIQQIPWIITKSKSSMVANSTTNLDTATFPVVVKTQRTFSLLPLGYTFVTTHHTTLHRYLSSVTNNKYFANGCQLYKF